MGRDRVTAPHPRLARSGAARAAARSLGLVMAVLATACGSSAAIPRNGLILDDLGPIKGCTGIGHSGIEGYGVSTAEAFVTKVCDAETGSVVNLGIGGSTLQGNLLQVLPSIPSDASRRLSIVMWGANDLALYGPRLAGYAAGLRFLVSRLRTSAGGIHDDASPELSYRGPWESVGNERVTTADGGFRWTSPLGFRGGEVAFVVSFRAGQGAIYSFTLDGRRAGTLDTLAMGQPPPAPASSTPAAFRVAVPAGAGHVVAVRLSHIEGAANLEGWDLEARRPPLVVLVEHPRAPDFGIYDSGGWPFRPDNAQLLALDRVMSNVAHEFDGYVLTVNPDAEIRSNLKYYLPDHFHFDVAGNALIARLIERAIARNSHVTRAPGRAQLVRPPSTTST
ncbi:MAG: SGNH/GDSL hydrolase family protein [Solirubrobacteraceae bacterium]